MKNVDFFPQKLKELRGNRTLQEVADAIGMNRVTVGYYESGERNPDIRALYKLCTYYGVSSDYLLGLDNSTSDYDIVKKDNEKLKNQINQIKRIIG